MEKLNILLALALSCNIERAFAQIPQYQGEYQPNKEYTLEVARQDSYPERSRIYVFFNPQLPCENCPQALDLIERIDRYYYSQRYRLEIINYAQDRNYNFKEIYHLRQPLEVVLLRINDHSGFGYKKLTYLQDKIFDPVSFTEAFTEAVNNFLGTE